MIPPNIMWSALNSSCKIFENVLTSGNQATQRDLCDSWVYIKCSDLNYIDYKFLFGFAFHVSAKLSL